MEVIKKFEVPYLQILDETGKIVDKKEMPEISKEDLRQIYWLMILSREYDERCILLQRQGRIYTYASLRGQEAAQIASAFAMTKNDMAFPSFREHGVYITRGAPLDAMFLYNKGDERGAAGKGVNVFMPSIPVASHIPHAAGAGMAFHYQKKKAAAIAYFGDGSTSKGDFHEAMNFAGAFKANTVFLCQNNQWAISTPTKEQTAAETIAQKAIAYGFEGIRVDGNDIFAVYKVVKDALTKARSGKGPTLVECLTYRMGDHTTSDDYTKYRSKEEVKKHEKFDPITRLRAYLMQQKIMTNAEDIRLHNKAKKEVDAAIKKFEAIKPYPAEDIIKYLFAELPAELQIELEEIKSSQAVGGSEESKVAGSSGREKAAGGSEESKVAGGAEPAGGSAQEGQ